MTVVVFIIVLAVLIFVHELGHFLVAKASGIAVESFAIGFGPKIWSWRRGEVEYRINWLPLGGYVKIAGEMPEENLRSLSDDNSSETTSIAETATPVQTHDPKRLFCNQPRLKQALVLSAGIFFNFLFAWLIYSCVFTAGVTASTAGFESYADHLSNPRVMVTYIFPDSVAAKAGLQAGDIVEAVSNQVSTANTPGQVSMTTTVTFAPTVNAIQSLVNNSAGGTINLEYRRGSIERTVALKPQAGLFTPGKYAIGVGMDSVADLRLPPLLAVDEGFRYTVTIIRETVIGLYSLVANIFHGTPDWNEVAGPVGIAGIVGNAAALGWSYLAMITAIISINLGVVNLIPFPALDGGRLFILGLESLARRSLPAKLTNYINMIGFFLLMILMIFLTWRDIAKLIK